MPLHESLDGRVRGVKNSVRKDYYSGDDGGVGLFCRYLPGCRPMLKRRKPENKFLTMVMCVLSTSQYSWALVLDAFRIRA